MPRIPTRTKLLEFSLFITILALMGHLSVNYWERFVIQKEISKTKASLHSLRETLDDIGNAYNNLYKEIRLITKQVEKTDPVIEEGIILSKLMGHNSKVENELEDSPEKTEPSAMVHSNTNNINTGVLSNTKNKENQHPKKYAQWRSEITNTLNTSKKRSHVSDQRDADTQVYLMKSTAQQTNKYSNKRGKSSSSKKPPIKRYCTNDPHDSAHYCYAKV